MQRTASMESAASATSNHSQKDNDIDPHYWSNLYSGNLKKQQKFCGLVAWGLAGKPKLLTYSLKTLVRYGGICLIAGEGSIFRGYGISQFFAWQCLMFIATAVVVFFAARDENNQVEIDVVGLLENADFFNKFTPFVLGLYLSLVLMRWWSLRTDALGRVFDAISNVASLFACLLPRTEHRWIRELVVRWGLASIFLMVQAARDKGKLEDLVTRGVLTQLEIDCISRVALHGRPVVMWMWILRLGQESFFVTPAAVPQSPYLYEVACHCASARDGIQIIHTYLQTQLPFAYVHLITLLVGLTNIFMTMKCAVKSVVAATAPQIAFFDIFSELLMFITIPLLYQGLLTLSYIIQDPFGEDMLDFPIAAFTEYVAQCCDSALIAQMKLPPTAPMPRTSGWEKYRDVTKAVNSMPGSDHTRKDSRVPSLPKSNSLLNALPPPNSLANAMTGMALAADQIASEPLPPPDPIHDAADQIINQLNKEFSHVESSLEGLMSSVTAASRRRAHDGQMAYALAGRQNLMLK